MDRGIPSRTALQRWVLVVAALALAGTAHSSMDTRARVTQGESFVPSPGYARVLALGFDAVVSDFHWLQAVQLVGGEMGDTQRHGPLVGRLLDVATQLDPWVDHPYRFAALWLTDSPESVHKANRLLERGIAHHPRDWRNHYHLGFNHFFFLEDPLTAAEHFEAARPLPGAPPYIGALVARLRADAGGIELAARFLADLVRTTDDGYEKAEYSKALDEIETERRARFLDAARTEYWRRNGRDLERVEDLLRGPEPVLPGLPPAHPHFAGWEWVLDRESGEIVSSFYGSRYELHFHPRDVARREEWRARRAAEAGR